MMDFAVNDSKAIDNIARCWQHLTGCHKSWEHFGAFYIDFSHRKAVEEVTKALSKYGEELHIFAKDGEEICEVFYDGKVYFPDVKVKIPHLAFHSIPQKIKYLPEDFVNLVIKEHHDHPTLPFEELKPEDVYTHVYYVLLSAYMLGAFSDIVSMMKAE